jgi:predicted ester cyclase
MSEYALRRSLEQLVANLNRGDLTSIGRHIAEAFFEHTPAEGELDGVAVFHDLASGLMTALPDLHVLLSDLRADGELLRANLSLRGTKDGPLWGTPPSGKPFELDTEVAIRPRGDGDRFAVSFEAITVPEIIGALGLLELVNPPDQMDRPLRHPSTPPDSLLKLVFNGQAADKACDHLHDIRVTEPSTDVCEQCVAQGDIWPALRMCLTCGHVGCCDTSRNKHARQHYEQTGHPLVRSIRLDEAWMWCYADNAFFDGRTFERHSGG